MDLPQQRERVTVGGLGDIGVGKYTKSDDINNKSVDNVAKGGIIRQSNGTKGIQNELKPFGEKGNPASIEVDENISIGGLKHEYRHFLDDMDNGNPGLGFYLKDKDKFFEYEVRGYEEELKIARELGLSKVEDKILTEIEKRRREIYGE